mmetsp:Transcript_16178/g.34730  ORF Transcript_16178/g.34730 Transcript_16178/m.34730 type:complete len:143 (-) Transcript_16178:635-1063(-)
MVIQATKQDRMLTSQPPHLLQSVHPHLLRSTLVTSQRQGAANQARKSDESFSDHGYGGATNAVEKACELSNPQLIHALLTNHMPLASSFVFSTFISRPSTHVLLIAKMAASASSTDASEMKPKPLLHPVSASLAISARVTVP